MTRESGAGLSRLNFLKGIGLAFGSLASGAAVIPRSPERPPPPPPYEMIVSLDNPKFWTSSDTRSGEPILISQFDPRQYKYSETEYNLQNNCGEAIVTIVARAFAELLNRGDPDVRIADVIRSGFNGPMTDMGMKNALDLFSRNTDLFTVAKHPSFYWEKTQIIPQNLWGRIFDMARSNVWDRGGLLIARVLKYGTQDEISPPSHFVILSGGGKRREPLILDPRGGGENGQSARVLRVPLEDYCQEYKGDEGLLSIQGVLPILNNVP